MKTFILILLFSTLVFADRGGWVSSGGELFQLNKNPWFVRNTPVAKYCVVIDKASFSASEETIRNAVSFAFQYWKNELRQSGTPRQGFADLAGQLFELEAACSPQTDIRFLFGYGTLTAEEIEYLKEPTKYVGVTVRTDYDYVNLKGKGFVYISGDLGDKSYQNPGHLIPKAWENEKFLQYALMHEIGHVMGLPHTGIGLMSEVFLDQLLNKRFSKFYLETPLQSYLNPPMEFDVCTMNGSFNTEFFKVDPATTCLKLVGEKTNDGQLVWNVSSRLKVSSPAVSVGQIKGRIILDNLIGAKPSVVLQLPAEQKVFSFQDRLMNNFMLGPIFVEGAAKGVYLVNGSPRPYELHIDLRNDSLTMVGQVGGKQLPVLVYSPPSLLKMLYPIDFGP
jgi:hypothetical protein